MNFALAAKLHSLCFPRGHAAGCDVSITMVAQAVHTMASHTHTHAALAYENAGHT